MGRRPVQRHLAAAGQVDIDYSVHSAHTSVGSVVTTPGSFPRKTTVSSTFETDSDYVQIEQFQRQLLSNSDYVMYPLKDPGISRQEYMDARRLVSSGLDASNQPLLQFSLRVKFYVECHLLLRDQVTRHHYYLQLRENVLAHGQACSRELCLLLAGWALQADLGDRPLHAGTQYFRPADYFPDWLIGQAGAESILNSTPAVHRHNRGMSSAQAELAYIREASAVEAPFNLHLYRLRRRKSDTSGSVLLGICPNGVELYQEEKNSVRKLIASFIWTNIGRLGFEKKKFEISALTQKFTFYTTDDEKSKQLFHLCKETHLFTQSAHDRLALIQQRSEEERRTPASSLRRPRDLRPGWEYLQTSAGDAEQRVSVVSSTSSNATSGVVSDRTVPSLDDSDDDLQAELLAGCGAAESAESGGGRYDSLPLAAGRRLPAIVHRDPPPRRPVQRHLAAAGQVDIDYSVHSAHTSVGSVVTTPGSFPRKTTVSSTFETDSDYVQIEQFQRQLLSNSDYVMYPLKDPGISRQEYMDARRRSSCCQTQPRAGRWCPSANQASPSDSGAKR
ncbi:protein expanded-like [Pollicipes pollicipes]|uniref:protein expanded-like n=1 Tax=Pollicipes pollicipes TaxID=41117 RepID=UPI0018849732|nr:protein expanded-like [Pollicipes pollicipes]